MTANNERCERVASVLELYETISGIVGEPNSVALTDLLADLRHYCVQWRIDFGELLVRSEMHLESEIKSGEMLD